MQRSCAGPRCSACAARAFQREGVMTYIETWEEFAKSAEKLYLGNPWKVRSFRFTVISILIPLVSCVGEVCGKVSPL